MSEGNNFENFIIICECHSVEHQVVFRYDDEDDEVYMNIYLNKPSFLKRLKYLFGYKCRFGHWDEVIIHKDKFRKAIEKITEHDGKS